MEMLSHPVIAVILLLGILVIVHEAGHFFVGKFCGIPVEVFSVGFGPIIFALKRGETEYRLSAIPLGGFVKFYGSVPSEEVPESIKGREFFRASKRARLATIAAGPLANLVLAVFVFAGMVMHGIQQPPAIIGEILPNSPAERAGIKFGDKVISINEVQVKSWRDVQRMISGSPDRALNFLLERGQQRVPLTLVPESVKDEELPGQRGRIGISRVMIPSVISLSSKDGALAQAGIQSGDRLLRAEWLGVTYEIKYWQDALRFFDTLSANAAQQDGKILNLTVKVWDPTAEPENKTKEGDRTIQLLISADMASTSRADILSKLGISSGELMIFKTESPTEDLLPGDVIRAWNGTLLGNAFDFSNVLSAQTEPTAKLTILRNFEVIEKAVSLKAVEVQKAEGKVVQYTLPVVFWGALEQPDWIIERYTNPLDAIWFGLTETWDMTKSIGRAIGGLFTGEMPLTTLGGPIAIAKVASDSVRIGWQAFFSALALISINLALLNLIPIPILDGGQIVLISAEAAIRRPVSEVAIENYQKIGFVMVLALFVIATYNDVGRFWASMVRGVTSMF